MRLDSLPGSLVLDCLARRSDEAVAMSVRMRDAKDNPTGEFVWVFFGSSIVFVVFVCCRYCCRYFCRYRPCHLFLVIVVIKGHQLSRFVEPKIQLVD